MYLIVASSIKQGRVTQRNTHSVSFHNYTQATLPHDSTGLSPFQVEFGYEPRTSFDWNKPTELATPRERMNQNEAKKFARQMHDAWQQACTNMKNTQEK